MPKVRYNMPNKLIALLFLICWFILNITAESLCAQGFFMRGLIECALIDRSSDYFASQTLSFIFQLVPLYFALYYLKHLKKGGANLRLTIVLAVVSLFRASLLECLSDSTTVLPIVILLYFVYIVLDILLIISMICEYNTVSEENVKRGIKSGGSLRFFLAFAVGAVTFFIIFAVSLFVYEAAPKSSEYIGRGGTNSLGNYAVCIADDPEIVSITSVKQDRDSMLFNEFLMGFKLTAVSRGETTVTYRVYSGADDLESETQYKVTVDDDMTLTIEQV